MPDVSDAALVFQESSVLDTDTGLLWHDTTQSPSAAEYRIATFPEISALVDNAGAETIRLMEHLGGYLPNGFGNCSFSTPGDCCLDGFTFFPEDEVIPRDTWELVGISATENPSSPPPYFVNTNITIGTYPSREVFCSENMFDPCPGTFFVTTVVPIPPAVWLFGSGLLGLIGVARHKKAA